MTAPNASLVEFWNDQTPDLNDKALKKEIPNLPVIDGDFQTVRGGTIEVLAYLILQIKKSDDRVVIIRALASACASLFKSDQNFTGSKTPCEELTGLEIAAKKDVDPNDEIVTNFIDAESVTVQELWDVMEADEDEMGAYLGVLFLAGNKRVTTDNRSAFNEKRRNAALASVITDPYFFVNNSEYLADKILIKVYASFTSCMPLRSVMTARVVARLPGAHMGPTLAFINLFLLLVDSDMSALRIIKEAVLKYPWIRTDFPELRPEFNEANNAFTTIKKAPSNTRSFLKAIHGSNFVPANYGNIDNLTGVCKTVMKRTTPTYQNYRGGKITAAQEAKILERLGLGNELTESAAVTIE